MSESSDIDQNSDGSISDLRKSGQSLIKENCHNSRTSDKIDIRHETWTSNYNRQEKQNNAKKLDGDVMLSLPFFRFMADLEQSGSQIPDAVCLPKNADFFRKKFKLWS